MPCLQTQREPGLSRPLEDSLGRSWKVLAPRPNFPQLSLLSLAGWSSPPDLTPHSFGSIYHVSGVLSLPYAEVREPFEAWVDVAGGRSRIQYYHGDTGDHRRGGERQALLPSQRDQGPPHPGPERPAQPRRLPGVPCRGVPSPEVKHHMQVNPMWDFVAREEDRAHGLFERFRHRHGRHYGDAAELEHRRRNFLHNLRFIDSHNRANRPFRLAPNHLTDRTPGELAALRGRLRSSRPNHGRPFPHEQLADVALPESLDWRLYGAVTPVKDQAVCGSCWSFATTGTLEGALFLKTGELVPLSQQMLIDCSWDVGNFGCDGGLEWQAYDWIQGHGGLASADSYGPYEGQNGVCHSNASTLAVRLAGYVNVPPANPTALKLALLRHGPVAVNVDASPRSFAFYANGVYYEPQCGHNLEQLNHAVLLVGYGLLQGQAFWLLKNSWSPLWGNSGYMLLAMKDNDCGVTAAATYPILE
ncbi:digestive cysteine proteinase 2-like isoform X5 [Tachyglossus aculeatus]|uniref:digestive cysteine proteinase 2-like isoform X5 n=1 Tax=Tachyglossus aculeatus TaxID=9261 RepID=UPI0018F510AD|nr:digestive cysteine proteinase 2-like isoform X5 [Tachyglossus aculeatus]